MIVESFLPRLIYNSVLAWCVYTVGQREVLAHLVFFFLFYFFFFWRYERYISEICFSQIVCYKETRESKKYRLNLLRWNVHVENSLFQNCNILLVLSILKRNIINSLLLSNFDPVISFKEATNCCIRLGRSLWSANQLQGGESVLNGGMLLEILRNWNVIEWYRGNIRKGRLSSNR